ncbi:hypothetical protein [Pedobacter cryoconitis]|uniref:Uncharacterized protein n=1 Tax=Pedobacter cryoconitis TaxID=188932 RepID=A0A327TH66_9SPHI|nr:hypothetical protein [Pedobacter cryoconitis]RAJ37167.1 hypothetical protein LY11_00243 [Pedobacter cryoconitis]
MDRREIFNLLFRSSVNEPIVLEPDPVLETPAHLKTDQTIPVFKEWTALPADGTFKLELSTAYAFTVTLDLNYPAKAVNPEQILSLGIQPEKTSSIKTGINSEGYLFIDNLADSRLIPMDKLLTGIQLVLTVNPLGRGMSFTKLKIMDSAGLTIATLKTRQYTTADWVGGMTLSAPPFNLLRIQGLHEAEPHQENQTQSK